MSAYPSHGSAAKKVRVDKEENPEKYCISMLDFCSPACAFKYTAALLGWKAPGRPRGSRNKRKEVAAV
jgi:hypothetical protein